MLYDPLRYGVLSSDDRYSTAHIYSKTMNFSSVREESIDVFLFRWADLRQDFKKVPTDLLCIIAVGLADESDGIRQQYMALCFFSFVLLLLPLFVFLLRDLLHV